MRKAIRWSVTASVALAGLAAVAWAQFPAAQVTPPLSPTEAARKAWEFKLVAIDGEPMPLAKYRGNVVLLVNTASFCGFKPQFAALQVLQDKYGANGFTVIGVPSGSFKDQEYGSNKEIADNCNVTGIRFPMAEKSDVVGPKALPIYRWAITRLGADNAPQWNFHKYLIGRNGRSLQSFGTRVDPSSPTLIRAIESALTIPYQG